MSNDSLGPCEVVGIFHAADDLEDAIDELMHSGFDRAELSLLASEDAVAEKLSHFYCPVIGPFREQRSSLRRQ